MPSTGATIPATSSRALCRVVRQPSPPTRRTLPDTADRCEACGEAGRPERATMMGTRAAARAGRQEAAVAVTTGSVVAAAIAYHGRLDQATRCSTARCRYGA